MKVTIYDVAKEAGVAISTVSKVLNGTGKISEKTREKVNKTIRHLEYQPNVVASAKKNLKTFGLLIPDISNSFLAELTREIENVSRRYGFNLIICSTDGDAELELNYFKMLKQNYVDGIILTTGSISSDSMNWLNENKIPLVILVRDIPYFNTDKVLVDDYYGAFQAVSHLITNQHTKIGMIAEKDISQIKVRVEAYQDALKMKKIAFNQEFLAYSPLDIEEAKKVALDILRLPDRPTAFFVSTDLLAVGLIHAANELNLHIPADLSIVGFDDSIMAKVTSPQLTTVAQPKEEMAEKAVLLLLAAMKQPQKQKEKIILTPAFINRDSVTKSNGAKKT